LIDIRFIEHAQVNDDPAGFPADLGLKTHTEPAVRLVVLFESARRHGVGENRKLPRYAALLIKAFEQQVVLVIEHGCLNEPGSRSDPSGRKSHR